MFLKNVRRRLTTGVRHLCSKKSSPDHYDTLQLPRSATQSEVKNAYFELSKQYHPDKVKATDENISKFRNITEAYEVLGNVENRRKYDKGEMSDLDVGVASPEEAEQEDDPLKRFYEQKKAHELGKTFDAWTAAHHEKMRIRRVRMKAHQEELDRNLKESDDDKFLPFVIIISVIIGAYILYIHDMNHPDAVKRRLMIDKKINDNNKR